MRNYTNLMVLLAAATSAACGVDATGGADHEQAALGMRQAALIANADLPGRVEAEDYTRALEFSSANLGGQCDRGDGVDMELSSDPTGGTCNIGWTDAGEWIEFDLTVAETGNYDLSARVASAASDRSISVSIDGASQGTISLPSQGWQAWENRVLSALPMTEGTHTIRFTFDNGLSNLNYFEVLPLAGAAGEIYTYDSWRMGDVDVQTWEGENTLFSAVPGAVPEFTSSLVFGSILPALDQAMENYRTFGGWDYPSRTTHAAFPDNGKGSVAVLPIVCGAGCGVGAKADVSENYKRQQMDGTLTVRGSENPNYERDPSKATHWWIALYELGRGTHFDFYRALDFRTNEQGDFVPYAIGNAFPGLVTHVTMHDMGFSAAEIEATSLHRLAVFGQLYDGAMAQGYSYMDFHPEDGSLPLLNGVAGNDVMGSIFYDFYLQYGKEALTEFFGAASALPDATTSMEAACNLSDAMDLALVRAGYSTGTGSAWLVSEMAFPTCENTPPCSAAPAAITAATASSVEGAAFDPSRAVDGSSGTRWSSQFSDPQWLQLDLGFVQRVTQMELDWEAASSAHYEIQVSDDGVNFTTVYQDTAADGGVDVVDFDALGRYVRLYSHSRNTPWGVSLWEVSVQGCGAPSVEVTHASFSGDWYYHQWNPVPDTLDYNQFVIGTASDGSTQSLNLQGPGADDRGSYLYQYFHRNGLCAALGSGTFDLSSEIWPGSDSSRAGQLDAGASITCP